MPSDYTIARSELILGGQKSGKSRRAEILAGAWLTQSTRHRALLIATARAGDDEMRQRIARHRLDREQRLPRMSTVEEPLDLAQAIRAHSRGDTLIVVDCLTLWLTNLRMPLPDSPEHCAVHPPGAGGQEQAAQLVEALHAAAGPVVVVGNEIGLGVIPLGRETRAFVDALGNLNQAVAQACERVTLMAAGLPLTLKGSP